MKNLFEMGSDLGDSWTSDNKEKKTQAISTEIKAPQKHQLHLSKEKRRGKVVTIVQPFYLAKNDLQALLKSLKKKLGTGGTIKENTLEFQGDIPKQILNSLKSMEYRFKN
jgi:translation initiation factor 1